VSARTRRRSGLFATGEIMGLYTARAVSRASVFAVIVLVSRREMGAEYAAARRAPGSDPAKGCAEAGLLHRFMEPKKDALSVAALKNRLETGDGSICVCCPQQGRPLPGAKEIDAIESDIARIQVPRFVRSNLEWTRAIEFPFVV